MNDTRTTDSRTDANDEGFTRNEAGNGDNQNGSRRSALRSKRVLIPAVAVVAVLGAVAIGWAVLGGDDDRVSAGDRDRAEEAALAEVGGGTVTDVEADDDTDEGGVLTYDVEVRDENGVEWDITLDSDFAVIGADSDNDNATSDNAGSDNAGNDNAGNDNAGNAGGTANSGQAGSVDADDAPITEAERTAVTQAAQAAVEGGTVVDIDRSDDAGEAWEVEVTDASGADFDVTLDADLNVLSSVRD